MNQNRLRKKEPIEKLGIYSPKGKYKIIVTDSYNDAVFISVINRDYDTPYVMFKHGFGTTFVHELSWIEGKEGSHDYLYIACKAGMSHLHDLTMNGKTINHTIEEIRKMGFETGLSEDPRGEDINDSTIYVGGFTSYNDTIEFTPDFSHPNIVLAEISSKNESFIKHLHEILASDHASFFRTPSIYRMCCKNIHKMIVCLPKQKTLLFNYTKKQHLPGDYCNYELK